MLQEYNLDKLTGPLQDWFTENARVLPWRENPSAYYVWVSEIMLQQTRVEAVKPYFDRFIRELPDVKALAECPEDKLLKLWEGLGYYNRVRNLKVAANQIMDEYDGIVPDTYDALLKLKGIGQYTAGAIASIAYKRRVPAVDGNVLRVISRVTADDSDIALQNTKNRMTEALFEVMQGDDVRPEIWNQALMELGAVVCLPNGAPRCEVCPWKEMCEARKQNRISELPKKSALKKRRIEKKTVLLIKDGEKIALHKREKEGLLAGLYEFPNLEGEWKEEDILDQIEARGFRAIRIQPLCEAKHIFSHIEWQMKGYMVFLQAKEYEENIAGEEDWIFVDVEEIKKNYAIPSAFVKYTEFIDLRIGMEAVKDIK